jgi:tetratricopeptide (TPR) repeat protein
MRTTIHILMLAFVLLPWAVQAQAPDDPEVLLREGSTLIEENCGDCMGSTSKEMMQGIEKVERALELGLPDPEEAYRLLANGWGEMAHVFLPPDSAEQEAALERQRKAFEKLVVLAPRDVSVLYEYAFVLDDKDARMAVLQRILDLDPNHDEALFALGRIEVKKGDPKGFARMQRAFEMTEMEVAREYGEALFFLLQEHGRAEEAREVKRRLEEIEKDIRRSYGRHD